METDRERRRLYLHVGTHKTGTTSIQEFVALNERALAERGIAVPLAGRPLDRPDIFGVGHHNIAWNIAGSPQFVPAAGGFDDLLLELRTCSAPAVLVTSEEFEALRDRPADFERIARGIRGAGYEPYPILYLRPQHDYAQSLYAQLAKSGHAIGFEEYLTGFSGDYEPFVEALAHAFGVERLILRAYRSDRNDASLLGEFWNALTGEPALPDHLEVPEALNVSPSIMHVLAGMYRTVRERDPGAPRPEQLLREHFSSFDTIVFMEKFDALTADDARGLLERFGASNRRIEARFGIGLPFQTARDVPEHSPERAARVAKHRRLLDLACRRWNVGSAAGRHGQGQTGTIL